ncbi:MAG: UDP-N-acetylmuramate dehydrogenase [Stellaceae bacterium]
MMAASSRAPHLIDRLPKVRGRLTADAPLAQVTWFRVGGPAEVLFRPADGEDLSGFLAAKPGDVLVTVIGVASNLLVRDGGIKGVVIRLGRGFVEIAAAGETITAGAGALDLNVAIAAREAGIAGLEFLSGIPGTVGGGLRMNAGAYGSEFKDMLQSAVALDAQGARHELAASDLELSYRHCGLPEDWIFVAARFAGAKGDPLAIARRMNEIQSARAESQPIRSRTGGSTFANPPGRKAWELIDASGCRGLQRGGAMVSEKHANFLINTGNATAADLETLGEEVRARVLASNGIALDWEIRRVGAPVEAAR